MPETPRFAEPTNIRTEVQAYTTWVYLARTAEGETIDMVRDPSFWREFATRAQVRDVIKILADDGSFEWHGRITHKGQAVPGQRARELFMREIYHWEGSVEKAQPSKPVDYEVAFAGPHHKWRITVGTDVIRHGFDDRAQAEEWLRAHKAGPVKAAA
jgi:hypothetical protein